jgi:hypothetical protein
MESYLAQDDPEFGDLPAEEQIQHLITERMALTLDNGVFVLPGHPEYSGEWVAEEANTDGGYRSQVVRTSPLVTGCTVFRNMPTGIDDPMFSVRITRMDSEQPEVRYLLTINSHGLGILGLFGSPEKAQAAAQKDEDLRTAAENEQFDDDERTSPVQLAWKQDDNGHWNSVFDQGVHVHYYTIIPLTTGQLLDGF